MNGPVVLTQADIDEPSACFIYMYLALPLQSFANFFCCKNRPLPLVLCMSLPPLKPLRNLLFPSHFPLLLLILALSLSGAHF